MGKKSAKKSESAFVRTLIRWRSEYVNVNFVRNLFLTSDHLTLLSILLLIAETIVCLVVVNRVKYTEIDWIAYMQEVGGFLNGTLDYSLLKGDTGPLVYPAGFVYIYSFLYYVTNYGSDIRCGQYIFVLFYLMTMFLVFRIYVKTKKVPGYVFIIMCCTTYRIHSIYLLRLFNDPIAMILLYAAVNLFLDNKWRLGSVVFSTAVAVKMNVLLFAPALFVAYLSVLGIRRTIVELTVCAVVQLILGAPFLLVNPYAYLKGSFDLGRVFQHQWTVNWRFLPETIFVNPTFHLALLTAHICLLAVFAPICIRYLKSYANLKKIESDLKLSRGKSPKLDMSVMSQLFVFPMFLANFIGIVCSRSLHYQFYVWYYHGLPYLLWCAEMSVASRLTILGLVEFCWNAYPSTDVSSAVLHLSHFVLLFNLYRTSQKRLAGL